MKTNTSLFEIEEDICAVECDIYDASIEIVHAESGNFSAAIPVAKNVNAACSEGTVYITQKKRPFLCARQQIVISVPEHTVPSLKICTKGSHLSLTGGIYSDMSVNADGGEVNISSAVFESCEILGGEMNAKLSDCTVKTTLCVKLDKGDILTEKTFATRAECRTKQGNIGASFITFKDGVFEAEKGNLNVAACGSQDEYNISVFVKKGTANCGSLENAGAERDVSLYSGEGNAVLEFIEREKPATPPEADNAAPEDMPETQEDIKE